MSKKKKEPTNRQLKVNELLRRNISEILSQIDLYELGIKNVSITVTQVKCSTDLKIAYVYVFPLGGDHEEIIINYLVNIKGLIKKKLSKKINLKFMPEINFLSDDTFEKIDNTIKMFKEINKT